MARKPTPSRKSSKGFSRRAVIDSEATGRWYVLTGGWEGVPSGYDSVNRLDDRVGLERADYDGKGHCYGFNLKST